MSFILSSSVVILTTYFLAVLIGPILISYFKRLSVSQIVREEGLASHHKKSGTTTMGAFIFLIPSTLVILVSALVLKHFTINLVVVLLSTLAFSGVGFIDDYRKVIKKQNEGLKSKEKLIGQLFIGLPLAIYATYLNTTVWIPFTDIMLDLGYFKSIFVLFVVIATTNAVNLTDGVDGLSSSVTIIVMAFFVYVGIVLNSGDIQVISLAMMGGLFGFLMYNKNPAKIFMGDVGSLALGGAVVALAIVTNTLLLIPIVGVIYFIETLSVTIQVLYFKKTGKRIFKMSPIHHHFELCGWSEKKIVFIFSGITIIGVVLGVISMMGRL